MKNEDNLVLQLARMALNLPAYQSSESFNTDNIDWDYFIKTSLRHGMFLLIYQILVDGKYIDVSDKCKISLKTLAQKLMMKSLQMSTELIRICDVLVSNNIPVIPFKGPTLSKEVYGKVGLRIFGDLDILVKESDVKRVLQIFSELNYKPLIELDTDQLQKYIVLEDDMQLSHPNGITVEVHWETTGRYAAITADYNFYRPNIIHINFHGSKIQQFGTEDQFIYLCLHGTRHLWERLEWLFSVASLLKNSTTIDYTYVLAKAKKMRCQKIVLQAILMVKEVFNVDVPLIIQDKVSNDRKLVHLVRRNKLKLLHLYDSEVFSSSGHRFNLFNVSMRDNWTDSIKYLLKQLFGLRVADVQFMNLPSSMYMLYYIIRPCRLILKGLNLL